MNGPLRAVTLAVSLMFALLVGATTYHQVIAGPSYRDDARNPRVVADRTGRERGTIITFDGTVVASSQPDPNDARVFRRVYPEGQLYAHVVGYSSALFGSTGVERAFGSDLVSSRAATISGVVTAILGGDVRGRGLRLTIEDELQRVAAEALGDQRGAVIALDPDTGAILAMVSKPSFDPNMLLGLDAGPIGDALEQRDDRPLVNRGIAEAYPPGSSFKPITTAAALETGIASPATTYPDPVALELPGSTATIRNYDRGSCGNGATVDLTTAFAQSCNTVFGAIGLELGAEPLVTTAESFGYNAAIPFELDVIRSVIPSVEDFTNDLPGVAQSAIGQRDVRATPLQMALVAAGIANGGEIMEPHLVAEVFKSDASIERRTEPVVWRRALSPAAAEVLTELMERVVTTGTGRRAAVPGVRIAGKTGTAEVPEASPHLWFIGFGPIDPEPGRRRIAIAVLVESGGDVGEGATGGTVAAPIARAVLAEFFDS